MLAWSLRDGRGFSSARPLESERRSWRRRRAMMGRSCPGAPACGSAHPPPGKRMLRKGAKHYRIRIDRLLLENAKQINTRMQTRACMLACCPFLLTSEQPNRSKAPQRKLTPSRWTRSCCRPRRSPSGSCGCRGTPSSAPPSSHWCCATAPTRHAGTNSLLHFSPLLGKGCSSLAPGGRPALGGPPLTLLALRPNR